ncbi:hypothetical protein E1176_08510 [Fulvivirga sp. RKSG066]|nr:hypothetical protein [Fulvivirga aurantia]
MDPLDSGKLGFGVNTFGFNKNNEYFNKIADGYTLFGYQVNPYLSYQPLPNVRFDVGIFLQKDFGANGYQSIEPTYRFKYIKHDVQLIFGTLEGSISHRLVEPLYDFEKVLIDRLENGIQLKLEKEKLFADLWVDWQKMIFKGDPDQEEVTGGLSLDYKILDNEKLALSLPLQFVVYHKGGQIDDNPNPLQTYVNTAVGADLKLKLDGRLKALRFSNYYLFYQDFSSERLLPFENGSGIYLNTTAETDFNVELMLSYWKGHEFISIMGGQLYPSVSSTFKNPNHTEQERELLIMRFFHELKLAKNLSLTSRFEPFYDLGNSKFEFSHGFYLNYNLDYTFKKGVSK